MQTKDYCHKKETIYKNVLDSELANYSESVTFILKRDIQKSLILEISFN